MGGVEFVLREGHISKVLENICQHSHVESQVEVVIVFECLTVVTPQHFKHAIVLFPRDYLFVQLTVKFVSRRKACFGQNFGTRDVLVGVDTFFMMLGFFPKSRSV